MQKHREQLNIVNTQVKIEINKKFTKWRKQGQGKRKKINVYWRKILYGFLKLGTQQIYWRIFVFCVCDFSHPDFAPVMYCELVAPLLQSSFFCPCYLGCGSNTLCLVYSQGGEVRPHLHHILTPFWVYYSMSYYFSSLSDVRKVE